MNRIWRSWLVLATISGSGTQGCTRPGCSEEPVTVEAGSVEQAKAVLKDWLAAPPEHVAANTCTVAFVLDRRPESGAEWLAGLREEDIAEVARRMRNMVEQYDASTQVKLCGGSGAVLGRMLHRAVVARDLHQAFRAGLFAHHIGTALREAGQSGWSAFESRLREPLRAHPSPESQWPEEKNAWDDHGILISLMLKSAGSAADESGLDDQGWDEIKRAVKAGAFKARDTGGWEREFGQDPGIRDRIEKEYRTTFKTPLAVATP